MSEIITKINAAVSKHQMLISGDTVVIGVSGGADSMLLLYYLMHQQDKMKLHLIVANVEHGIRGEASKQDTLFVQTYCKEHAIEFHSLSCDVPREAAEHKMSIEAYARDVRYRYFESFSCDKIAVAHNLSDSAETVIFNLVRGASIKGAAGIAPVRGKLIRPLIECTKDEILTACAELGIPYVTDETNQDDAYTRNYIRHRIMPCLAHINPAYEKAFSRFSQSAREDYAYLESVAKECLMQARTEFGIPLHVLRSQAVPIAKRMQLLYFFEFGFIPDEAQLSAAMELIENPGALQLRGDLMLTTYGGHFFVSTIQLENSPQWMVSCKTVSREEYFNKRNEWDALFPFCCDADKIKASPTLRKRREGDTIAPAGRKCTKQVRKLMNELKIPAQLRDTLPMVCDGNKIIGIYGYAVDNSVAITPHTERVLLLNITTEDYF